MGPQQGIGALPPVVRTPQELDGATLVLRVGEMVVVPTDLTLAVQSDTVGIVEFEPGRCHGGYTTNPGFTAVDTGTTVVRLLGSGGGSEVRFSVIVRRDDPDEGSAAANALGSTAPAPKPRHGGVRQASVDKTSGAGDNQ